MNEEELELIRPYIIECSDELFQEAYNDAYNYEDYSSNTETLINFINDYINSYNYLVNG